MKFWRQPRNQRVLKAEIEQALGHPFEVKRDAQGRKLLPARLGRALKSMVGVVKESFPSPLLQHLMLRNGYWPLPEGAQP